MEYRNLGRTGVKISTICLGSDDFGDSTSAGIAEKIIIRSVDAGINLIDTGNLYAEGESTGKVMCIGLHPYIIGKPHRIEAFNEVLTYILGHPLVWQTTADEIAKYFMEHYYEQFVQHAKTLQEKPGLLGRLDQ